MHRSDVEHNAAFQRHHFASLILNPMHKRLRGFRTSDMIDRHSCAGIGEAKYNRLADAGIAACDDGVVGRV